MKHLRKEMHARKYRPERGQAMVELALLMPLLITLLLAVGYFGHAVTTQQSLSSAVRFSARKMAIESTESTTRRYLGNYSASATRFLDFARDSLSGTLRSAQLRTGQTQLNHFPYTRFLDAGGEFQQLNEHAYLYKKTATINMTAPAYNDPMPVDKDGNPPAMLENMQVGIGALYYGGTLGYHLSELDPIAKYIGLKQGIYIRSTSLMPAELPLRSTGGYGLLDLNPWISDIVTKDISEFPDLID